MPTYDYKCIDCNDTFEEFQKMTDPPLEKCTKCGGNLKRLIGTGIAPIFKGTGFYQTDYKNSSNEKTTDTDSGKSKSVGDKTSPSKDSKIEKKSA